MKNVLKSLKKPLKALLFLFVLSFLSIILSNYTVKRASKGKTYNTCHSTPYNKVGLLLGTNKYYSNGYQNQFYRFRIEAAANLYKAEKIDFIIVSGDNSKKEYDEPTEMKNDLIALGIPESKIYPDYAGFRTLDSVVRSKEIFGQTKITIISQKFHNERAIFIARKKGISAIGYNAQDVSKSSGKGTLIREKFARVKMILDLTFGKKPRFLGEKIEIK